MSDKIPLRILVVEDSAVIRADICQILNKMGCEVTAAENGRTAWLILQNLKKVPEKLPDLVLSDVNMPEMDGIQLLEKIRTDKQFVKLPVIILTANKEELLRMTALCLDVNGFFIKPADKAQLLSTFTKLFPAKKFRS